jgi:hypothetical protein
MGGGKGKREQISEIGRRGDGPQAGGNGRCRRKKANGKGLSGYLFPLAGILHSSREIGAPVACLGSFVLESRVRFVLWLSGFRAAGRLVFLFLLPGDFSLPFLEGEFCSCHGWPPFAFLSLWELL